MMTLVRSRASVNSLLGFSKINIVIVLSLLACVDCLRMTAVRVPAHVAMLSSVRLECVFDLEEDTLYSVKWYKDGYEFYQYHPGEEPPGLFFPEQGLPVDVENSSDMHVMMTRVPLTAGGRYRCEVSGEAPFFHTASGHGDMAVVAVPESGPVISGGKPRYQAGEWARLNCTLAGSSPAATLTWYINGEPAEPGELVGPTHAHMAPPQHHLFTTTLGLRFRVRARHFRHGDMKLKCLATIGTLYSRSNEESVDSNRLQKSPVLESRAVAADHVPGDSRVDRVQASPDGTSKSICLRPPPPLDMALWCTLAMMAALQAFNATGGAGAGMQ